MNIMYFSRASLDSRKLVKCNLNNMTKIKYFGSILWIKKQATPKNNCLKRLFSENVAITD